MHGRKPDVVALVLALIGCLVLAVWAVRRGAEGEGSSPSTTVNGSMPTMVERLVPSLPPTRPTALPWTPHPASATLSPEDSVAIFSTQVPIRSATREGVSVETDFPARPTQPQETELPAAAFEESTTLAPVPSESKTSLPSDGLVDNRWRFGAVNRLGGLEAYDVAALHSGWFLTGTGGARVPPGTELVYLVSVNGDSYSPVAEQLSAVVAVSPGAVWQIGNEPDVIWQSNCTPEQYAGVYHEVYTTIKAADPTARVAAGAISQPTPLRLQYLDLVLSAYEIMFGTPMPVDVWAVHNSILREELGSWGVDIPPGIGSDTGRSYEINDNDRLDIFQQQLAAFRVWMRDRGFQDRPVYLTEFSILMPAEYGFPPERVAAFMTGAFDYLLSAADKSVGYPADGYRLVQQWAWYSVADTSDWGHYPTGNLFDPVTKEMTPLGRAFAAYIATH